METAALALALGAGAGFAATLLGIGGGAIIVPLLVLAGVDVKVASPASLVAILGTSIGGLRYLYSRGLVNLRVAVVLEATTTLGAAAGVWLYGTLTSRGLGLAFAATLALSALGMHLRRRAEASAPAEFRWPPRPARLAAALAASLAAGLL
ncbi:MAG: sulfite exporter TauE/SafE family protein, partial [Desulfurococcales archaeon]|nr:sulfite exporter TauE/SafE family protein [Desulfurococcales archaeon]